MPAKTKVCTVCGKRKPLGEFNRRGDGPWRRSHCRPCCSAALVAHTRTPAGRATRRRWEEKNKELVRGYMVTWRAKNIDKVREYQASWYERNRDWTLLNNSLNKDIGGR